MSELDPDQKDIRIIELMAEVKRLQNVGINIGAENIALRQQVDGLRDALIPFARIWAISAPLDPDITRSIRPPCGWPTYGDTKTAHELVWRHRKPGQ
jgi:hypothetical protein